MSFNEAIKDVDCRISGRRLDAPVTKKANGNINTDYTEAELSVKLYNNKTGTGWSCYVPNGTKAKITDYYGTKSPSTSRFKVSYTYNKQNITYFSKNIVSIFIFRVFFIISD